MVVTQLRRSTLPLHGFLAKAASRQEGSRQYTLFLVHTGEEIPFSSEMPQGDWIRAGRFWFNPDALIKGYDSIHEAGRQKGLLMIDEVGPLEMKGQVWGKGIEESLAANVPMLWTVRQSLLDAVLRHWSIKDYIRFGIQKTHPQHAARVILENIY